MSKNFSGSNSVSGSESSKVLGVVVVAVVVMLIAGVAIVLCGMFLQGDKIKSEREVVSYILENKWWEEFKPDNPPITTPDGVIQIGDKSYFSAVFIESAEPGLLYRYLVDSDGIVYYLDSNMEVKPLDKKNQIVMTGIDVNEVRIATRADAANLVLKEGYSIPDEMDLSSTWQDSIIKDGKMYYRIDISYPAKGDKPAYVDKLYVMGDATVLVEDENGKLVPATFYGIPEENTGESGSSSSTSASSSSSESSSSSATSGSSSSSESGSSSATSTSSSSSQG